MSINSINHINLSNYSENSKKKLKSTDPADLHENLAEQLNSSKNLTNPLDLHKIQAKQLNFIDTTNQLHSIYFNEVRFIPDRNIPNNEMWVVENKVVEQILDWDTGEVRIPEIPIFIGDAKCL